MKHIKLFENFIEDPADKLTGNDLIVYNIVNNLTEDLFELEWFEKWSTRNRVDPIITSIVDQNKGGGTHDFPENKQFYIFLNDREGGKGYAELEAGIESNGYNKLTFIEPGQSSHGSPASYGETIYSYDRKTGEVKFDENFFKYLLNK